MAEMKELNYNIVLVLSGLTPAFFSQPRLTKHGICQEKDINGPDAIFVPQLVQVKTSDILFLATEGRVQIRALSPKSERVVVSIAEKLKDMLPKDAISAVGFNYIIGIDVGDVAQYSRKNFMPGTTKNNALHEDFAKGNGTAGLILQRDYDECRLFLDIRTQASKTGKDRKEVSGVILYNFNFHFDTSTKPMPEFTEACWKHWKAEAQRIASLLEV